MIELAEKKLIKANQRKKLQQTCENDDLYKTNFSEQDDIILQSNSKRYPQESIDEEYHSRLINAPFVSRLPNFQELQNNLNQNTIQSSQDNLKLVTNQFYIDFEQYQYENEEGSYNCENEMDYTIIEIHKLGHLMTFQNKSNDYINDNLGNNQKNRSTQIIKQGLLRKSIHKQN